jgi:nuclear pore complex protein Nup53
VGSDSLRVYLWNNVVTQAIAQGSQRADEAPLLQTKAKINHWHALLRGSASDFGMDSMFENSRYARVVIRSLFGG